MPTLHYFPLSQGSRAVAWFVEYAKKDVEMKVVNVLAGEQKEEAYVAKFPAGQVPSFEDGDLRFAESTAILQYLAHDNEILPQDRKERARLQEYFGKHNSNARRVSTDLFRPLLLCSEEERPKTLEKGFEAIHPMLEKYNEILGKNKYLLGDKLTLADFMFSPEVDQLLFLGPDMLDKYPNIKKYIESLETEPGYTTVRDAAIACMKSVKEALAARASANAAAAAPSGDAPADAPAAETAEGQGN